MPEGSKKKMYRSIVLIPVVVTSAWVIICLLVRRRRRTLTNTSGDAIPPDHSSSRKIMTIEVVENEALIKWQSVMEIWDREADRFWTRSNIFLIVNGALLLAVTSFASQPMLGVIVSVFGLLFVRIWMYVNRIGKYYVDRWRMLLEQLEEPWEHKLVGQLDELEEQSEVASRLHASTTYMYYALRLMFFLWLGLCMYELYLLITGNLAYLQRFMNWVIGHI